MPKVDDNREEVFALFDHRCLVCRQWTSVIHEIEPRSHGNDPLRLENRIPLCNSCHEKAHENTVSSIEYLKKLRQEHMEKRVFKVKHIVLYSGGLGSYYTTKRLIERGIDRKDIILLFTDTKVEDEDLYRFLEETSEKLEIPITNFSDGRTIWEVCLYVGSSINLGERIITSYTDKIEKFENIPLDVYYIPTDSPQDAQILEIFYIDVYKPKLNKNSNFPGKLSLNISPIPEWIYGTTQIYME